MNSYITGDMIKKLREQKKYTQKELADLLMVSEKTISKWETKRGLPDISLLEPLSKVLGVSLIELFNGELITNTNQSANILKTKFYICPICGNIITSIGESGVICCGRELIAEEAEQDNNLSVTTEGGEILVEIPSPMTKENYITMIAYVTSDQLIMRRLYPEQSPSAYFTKCGHGIIYYNDLRNGLFQKKF